MESSIKKNVERYGKRAAVCGAAVCAGWLAYKVYKRLTTSQPKVIYNPYREESQVEGSTETPKLEPKCQVKLGIESKGAIEVFGSGFRVNIGGRDFLATAGHNVAFGKGLYLVKGTAIHFLKEFEVIPTAYDSCLIPVDIKAWSQLGVSIARFAAIGNSDLYVEIVGASGKGTSGRLRASTTLMGMVEYEATTIAGYSGSVYFNGSTVYGMHILGGRANRGIAAMFLLHAFKIALKMSEEAYDRAFYNRIMSQRPAHGNVVFIDDFAVVETQMGYFYRFPKEDFLRYQNDEQQQDYPDEVSIKSDDFMDYEPENIFGMDLNSYRPGPSRAGTKSPKEVAFTPREKELLKMIVQSKPSTKPSAYFRRSKTASKKSTARQTPAALPSCQASSSTQTAV